MTDRDGKINPQGGRRSELPADFLLHRKNISEFYSIAGNMKFNELNEWEVNEHLKYLDMVCTETGIFLCPQSYEECRKRFVKSFVTGI